MKERMLAQIENLKVRIEKLENERNSYLDDKEALEWYDGQLDMLYDKLIDLEFNWG